MINRRLTNSIFGIKSSASLATSIIEVQSANVTNSRTVSFIYDHCALAEEASAPEEAAEEVLSEALPELPIS